MEWHRNENLDRTEEIKVMFEDFSEAVSGILVSRFLAPGACTHYHSSLLRAPLSHSSQLCLFSSGTVR